MLNNQTELERLTRTWALSNSMDPVLACAMVEQESSWNTFAYRPESESGFMARYGEAYNKLVRESANKLDDHWIKYEDAFYASYGLLQTMYPVIIETFPEAGPMLKFPTSLCDPDIGLSYGCRLFMRKLKQAKGSVTQALLYWNGGANKQYPDEVMARYERYKVK